MSSGWRLCVPFLLAAVINEAAAAVLPVFCKVAEESEIGTVVCNLRTKVGFRHSDGYFSKISVNDDNKCFKLERRSGELSVHRRIDREALVEQGRCSTGKQVDSNQASAHRCQLELTITYRNSSINAAELKLIYVSVQITDINDHSPRYQVYIVYYLKLNAYVSD